MHPIVVLTKTDQQEWVSISLWKGNRALLRHHIFVGI